MLILHDIASTKVAIEICLDINGYKWPTKTLSCVFHVFKIGEANVWIQCYIKSICQVM